MTGIGESAQETIVPVPATTMTQYHSDVEKYEKDLEKWDKDMEKHDKVMRHWKKLENKAIDVLQATTTLAVQTVMDDDTFSAKQCFDAIEERFAAPTSVSIWADFKAIMDLCSLILVWINIFFFTDSSGGNPIPEIARLKLLFDQLYEASIEHPDVIKAMLLFSILPQQWSNAHAFATNSNSPPELTFKVAHEAVINHYEARQPAPLVSSISSVKKKVRDLKFNQQSNSPLLLSNNNNQSNNDNNQKEKNN
ncbi:hypothetical protein AAF712_005681 [Marasmius tenuissimus]|uniref:Uncharacterized protein n=1 Tax=Marasmius tenuissimus TaxID=585030 RepID=A0ABR3A0X8_9AGAR